MMAERDLPNAEPNGGKTGVHDVSHSAVPEAPRGNEAEHNGTRKSDDDTIAELGDEPGGPV
jgi:hypothetical protein